MRILDRYIFREVLIPTIVALVALTFMLVARELGVLLELIVRGSASAGEIQTLVAAFIPGAMIYTIPLALLAGVLSAAGRFSSDSEAVAFRAAGVSIWQLLRPVLVVGLLAWGANFALAVWIAPRTAARLTELTSSISIVRQLPLELEPRVFNEDVEGLVIYVRDMSPDRLEWSGVFLADVSDRDQLNVTWAESGRLSSSEDGTRYEITLAGGSTEIVPLDSPDRYVSTAFAATTIPVPIPDAPVESAEALPEQIPTRTLLERIRNGEASFDETVQFHLRLALPFASIAFLLVGLPLGISTRRGGRSIGLVLSAVLMLAYYTIFIGGTRTAVSDSAVVPFIGTWAANIVFAVLGLVLLARSDRVSARTLAGTMWDRVTDKFGGLTGRIRSVLPSVPEFTGARHTKWFRVLDLYLIRVFTFFFVLVVVAFASLVVVVTLFELLPDIVENDARIAVIVAYFFFYTPQILYLVTPMAVLVAVFITLGSLTRTNETLAARAGAISLYRVAWPLIAVAILLSAGVYLMGDYMLPHTNQRQDAYRDAIKGRAPQTYLDPGRKWMAGSNNQIYFYNYFDPDQNSFAELSIFEFNASEWSLGRMTFAGRASQVDGRWLLETGWARTLEEETPATFQPFDQLALRRPMDGPDYFKREVRIASQMNFPELSEHIAGLRTAGFEVGGLTVELYTKLSLPLGSLIMSIIAVPFAFATGRRGTFYGIGIAMLIGIAYWAAFEVFGKLGGINQISPAIAAWFPNAIFGLGGIWMLLKVRT